MNSYLLDLFQTKSPSGIGNKADKLRFLHRQGFLVPRTVVCTSQAFADFRSGDERVLEILRRELPAMTMPEARYAVRSSANVEDGFEHSFAGQFKTVLDVRGPQEILEAIRSVWTSAAEAEVATYLQRHDLVSQELQMAVLIQEMVLPQVSGVAFSKNPTTGLDEVVVEAVAGRGDALVQEGVTPQR